MVNIKELERWAKQALKDYCGNSSAKDLLAVIRLVKKARKG